MSRPFEGFVIGLVAAAWILHGLVKASGELRRQLLAKAFVPATALGVVFGAWLLHYTRSVTGSPWTLPYQVYERTYSHVPILLWQELGEEPLWNHPEMRAFYEREMFHEYRLSRELFVKIKFREASFFYAVFFLGGLPLLAILGSPHLWRNRSTYWVAAAVAAGTVAALVQRQAWPRKMAPLTALILLIVIRHLETLDRSRPWLARALAGLAAPVTLAAALTSFAPIFHSPPSRMQNERSRIVRELTRADGRDLVIVRYSADHNPHEEWVYNQADIDHAPIVWAREIHPQRTQGLREHFADRTIWLLEPDSERIELKPYPETD